MAKPITQRLLATHKAGIPHESTHSDEWGFTAEANFEVKNYCIVVHDDYGVGSPYNPSLLVLPIESYAEVKLVDLGA